jgi:hypothetical protein
MDQRGVRPLETDLLIDLGYATTAGDGEPSPGNVLSPFIHPKANSVLRPSDGIGRSVFPVSGGESEADEDTLRVIAWSPSSLSGEGANASRPSASPDLEWLTRTLAESDLPTVICTPAWKRTPGCPTIASLASSVATHGHVVAWLSSHAGPTTCSLRAGIVVILFGAPSPSDIGSGRSASGGVLGMLEVGERLSLDLADIKAASIDMPLAPPADRWQTALA